MTFKRVLVSATNGSVASLTIGPARQAHPAVHSAAALAEHWQQRVAARRVLRAGDRTTTHPAQQQQPHLGAPAAGRPALPLARDARLRVPDQGESVPHGQLHAEQLGGRLSHPSAPATASFHKASQVEDTNLTYIDHSVRFYWDIFNNKNYNLVGEKTTAKMFN